MRRAMTIMTTVVALAIAATALAAQATKAPATKASAAASKPAMAHSASGKIAKFDAATNTLTISTGKGEESFKLASSTTIHQGSKTVMANDLANLTGQNAKIRYSETSGQKTATSVMVSAARTRAKASKKS